MTKKKHRKKPKPFNKKEMRAAQGVSDFTIDDSANAVKPVMYIRKSSLGTTTDRALDIIQDLHINNYISDDDTRITIKDKNSKDLATSDKPCVEYPEILWYLISQYILPEDIGNFARINKSTYSITKKRAFWLQLYKEYCENSIKLPEKLRADSAKIYGLRQTVIRALFFTYDVFVKRIAHQATQDSRPHLLVNQVCVNVWYNKGLTHWSVFFKFKKQKIKSINCDKLNLVEANPEEDSQVLQVTCKNFQGIPPLMGMTLSCVSMTLAQGFRDHKLQLGFTTARYATKNIVPECNVILDAVVGALVCDWWHPQYPHSGCLIPKQELPFLEKDFFDYDEE